MYDVFVQLQESSSSLHSIMAGAYYGAVYGMQVVGNWLSGPGHGAPQRRKLHHTHYCANVCGTKKQKNKNTACQIHVKGSRRC